MEITKPNWPKKGHIAIRPCGIHSDPERLESLIFPTEGAYMVAFQRAADMIVETAKREDRHPDELFFPVAYLYRHHLELMLKDIVHLGERDGTINRYAEETTPACQYCGKSPTRTVDVLAHHNLHRLWNKAKQLIMSQWPDSPDADLKATESVILEFHKLDPDGQAFRYAKNTNGTPHFDHLQEPVDLVNLKTVVDGVSNFLDAVYAGIDYCDPGEP